MKDNLIELIKTLIDKINKGDKINLNSIFNSYWNDKTNGVIIKCINLPNIIKFGQIISFNDLIKIERVLATNVFISIPNDLVKRELNGYNPQIDIIIKNILILILNMLNRFGDVDDGDNLIILLKVNIIDKLNKLLI